jgi:hypothetical protein
MAPTAPTSTAADQDTWDAKIARLRARQPREIPVRIPDEDAQAHLVHTRVALAGARGAARARLDDADQEITDEAVAADEQVQEAAAAHQEALDDEQRKALVWRLRALPADVYDTFALGHPPTDAQKDLGMQYDPKTYVPAIIAACTVDEISAETIADMQRTAALNQGDMGKLMEAVRQVNQKSTLSLGKG